MPPLLILILLVVNNHVNSDNIISSSCITTLYPELCYSTLLPYSADLPTKTKKDVIQLTLHKTKDAIQANFHTITNLTINNPNLSKRAKSALYECLDMEAATLDQLDTVIHHLRDYPATKKPLRQYADDLNTLMSATITNKETCLDGLGLSYDDDDNIYNNKRLMIIQGEEHGGKMCSNVLAMIKNMTDTDMMMMMMGNKLGAAGGRRKLNEKMIMWPEWLSAGDRKLLGLGIVVFPDVTVSKDGKGKYKTVAEAVEAAPTKSKKRYVIKIAAGTYKEHIQVSKHKNNIMFVGDGRGKTIITGNNNVAAGGGMTTSKSATVAVLGERFLARDITFQNTAGASGHQAVALRVASDLSAFYKCSMEGYQDTLYVHSYRQFYVNCLVTGTVDFIFGNAAAVFQFCDIMARKPNANQLNMITAQGRTDKNQDTGIVIHKCNIGATPELKQAGKKYNYSTYLGRPWKKFSRTVVMKSVISEVINKEGWHPWEGDFALDTLYYREYRNIGPGSDTSKRVKWKGWGVIKDRNEATSFTVAKFINGWTWLLSTGVPFWPGL